MPDHVPQTNILPVRSCSFCLEATGSSSIELSGCYARVISASWRTVHDSFSVLSSWSPTQLSKTKNQVTRTRTDKGLQTGPQSSNLVFIKPNCCQNRNGRLQPLLSRRRWWYREYMKSFVSFSFTRLGEFLELIFPSRSSHPTTTRTERKGCRPDVRVGQKSVQESKTKNGKKRTRN